MNALNQKKDLHAAVVQPKPTICDPQSLPTRKHLPRTLKQTLDWTHSFTVSLGTYVCKPPSFLVHSLPLTSSVLTLRDYRGFAQTCLCVHLKMLACLRPQLCCKHRKPWILKGFWIIGVSFLLTSFLQSVENLKIYLIINQAHLPNHTFRLFNLHSYFHIPRLWNVCGNQTEISCLESSGSGFCLAFQVPVQSPHKSHIAFPPIYVALFHAIMGSKVFTFQNDHKRTCKVHITGLFASFYIHL